jgi:2-iminobutanoate/2-iminopropanoate deaminase
VWLRRAEDFAAFNAAHAERFPVDPPARSTVRADLMVDALVEIEAVAQRPASNSR